MLNLVTCFYCLVSKKLFETNTQQCTDQSQCKSLRSAFDSNSTSHQRLSRRPAADPPRAFRSPKIDEAPFKPNIYFTHKSHRAYTQ